MIFKNTLSISSLLQTSRDYFSSKVIDNRKKNVKNTDLSKPPRLLVDYLMSGLALFHLKYSSLLQFDKDSRLDPTIASNLKTLYGVEAAPSDTQMRTVLDDVNPKEIKGIFKKIFQMLQRVGRIKEFVFMNGHYLLALDGTGYFSSEKVRCDSCCVKNHKDGRKTYYHQFLCGALIHPLKKAVIPFAPEPILLQDGAAKNDCERNAAVRFLTDLRREHPHLKIIITEDGLASNAPHIALLKELDLRFILGAKSGDHAFLFELLSISNDNASVNTLQIQEDKKIHYFQWMNNVALNKTNPDCTINFLDYHEFTEDKDPVHFSWVTDMPLNQANVMQIMQAGRARWGIENQVFNTLKNQGYNFEHNFGHGYKNLSVNMAFLMMLAFLIDQVSELACVLFQKISVMYQTKKNFWRITLSYFLIVKILDWEMFYDLLLKKVKFSHDGLISNDTG
jgi:hypothetical protein